MRSQVCGLRRRHPLDVGISKGSLRNGHPSSQATVDIVSENEIVHGPETELEDQNYDDEELSEKSS